MPLDAKRKLHQTRSQDELNEHDECYMMRATGELFSDYEEYLNALLEYQARKWSCSISGKGKLTYEEAQQSEKSAQRRVDTVFPEIFLQPLCTMVHMSQRRMDELVEAIFKRLSCFSNGEEVEWVQGDGREPLRVSVVKPVDAEEEFFIAQDPEEHLPSRYWVSIAGMKKKRAGNLEKSASGCENGGGGSGGEGGEGEQELELKEVRGDDLRRLKGRNVSRMTIRSKLKTVGNRESYWQAPFLCEDDMVQKFDLRADLPNHIRRLKLVNDCKIGKIKKEELALLDPGLAEERAKKRRRRSGGKDANDPLNIAKSVLKTAVQKKVWEATTVWVKRSFEVAARAEERPVSPVTVPDIAAALYADWNSGDASRVADTVGTEIRIEEYVSAAHLTLSDLLAIWPSEGDSKPLLQPPFEDSILPRDASLQPRPEPLTSFFVPDTELVLPAELLGKILLVWDLTQRFGHILRLSPFDLEDLVGAVCYPQVCMCVSMCVFVHVCVCVCMYVHTHMHFTRSLCHPFSHAQTHTHIQQECALSRDLHCALLRYLLQQHYEDIKTKEEEERRRKEKQTEKNARERESAARRSLGGEVAAAAGGDVDEDKEKEDDRVVAGKDRSRGPAKGRNSTGGGEKGAARVEEESESESEDEVIEDGVVAMPKARVVEEARWAETMVRYMHARTWMKEEKDAQPPQLEQPVWT